MPLVSAIGAALAKLPAGQSGTVVAVSGGADSVALLRALLALRRAALVVENSSQFAYPTIVAHLNHRLRGAESDADEQFVRDLHAQLMRGGETHLELSTERIDIASLGGNVEAVGRRRRYEFLTQVAMQYGVNRVVTGHTANDQAETVLHRLLRGTGLQGLRGIAPMRELRTGIFLVRPMLNVTRYDVLDYLEAIGQPFRDDPSNADPRFTRNRIRHDLIPLLERDHNPAVVTLLGRLADQAQELFAEIEQQALAHLRRCERPAAGALRILDAAAFADASRNLRRETLRQLWQREGWPRDRLGYEEWDRLITVGDGELTALDLPGGIRARRLGHVIQIGPPE